MFYSTFSCCKKQFQHHQMFCENIFSCSHMIMILYPLYIVHIITTALTPSSTSAQKACSPPLSLCFPVSWRSSRLEPMWGTHPSGEPLVSISLFLLNDQKPFDWTFLQGICCENSAADIRGKSCRGKSVSLATEEKKHFKSGANSMIFNNMIFKNMIFNNIIFNNVIFIMWYSIIWYDMTIVWSSTICCTKAGKFEIHYMKNKKRHKNISR